MDKKEFSRPVDLKDVLITDEFWHREQELVRTEVIPYQWEALNDRVPGAAPSYCMHNFRAAGRLMQEKRRKGSAFTAPVYTFRGFEALPEDPARPDPDKFYGFVFQDTDFSKWIEAVGYSLTWHPDPQLEQTADEAVDIVCAAQLENGYLDTYYIINGMDRAFTNLKDHHELYCLGHLVEGAVAYYQATGKDKLLRAACGYADYVAECFGPEEGKCKGYPGHEIAEMALVRLYEVTGEEKYLRLSRFFLDQRGTAPLYFEEEDRKRAALEGRSCHSDADPERYAYYQAHMPVRKQSEAVGHAVRAGYLYSGMADVARLTGDEEMFQACERLWNSIVGQKLYITGGVGGTRMGEAFSFPFDLPNDLAYSETCAAIALAFFARRMLQIVPDRKYSDVMELALYNTVLAGMALDGKSFFYVNPLEVVPEACRRDERKNHVATVRQKWFGCACCPPNIARIVSSAAAYAYTENEDTLWTHLYMGSTLTKKVKSGELELRMETAFPWEGSARMRVHACTPAKGTLAFRIPGWSRKGSGRILLEDGSCRAEFAWEGNGLTMRQGQKELKGQEGLTEAFGQDRELRNECCREEELKIYLQDGYLYLTGTWQDASVELAFPMEVRMKAASLKVREDVGKVAFTRGPVTYCMEEADNGKDLHLCRVDEARTGKNCEGVAVEMTEELGHPMAVLKVPGRRAFTGESGISGESRDWRTRNGASDQDRNPAGNEELYRDYTPVREESVILRLVPYYAWNNRGEGEMSVWIRI